MKKGRPLGLDELMIVNPGQPGGEAFLLGEDGTLYQVQGLGEEQAPQGLGQFFLGEEGALCQMQGVDAGSSAEPGALGRYFLGEDGTLYELVR